MKTVEEVIQYLKDNHTVLDFSNEPSEYPRAQKTYNGTVYVFKKYGGIGSRDDNHTNEELDVLLIQYLIDQLKDAGNGCTHVLVRDWPQFNDLTSDRKNKRLRTRLCFCSL